MCDLFGKGFGGLLVVEIGRSVVVGKLLASCF